MKNYLVTLGIAIAVFILGMVFVKPVQNVTNQVTNGTLGSASSPSVNGGCMDVNGVVRCYSKSSMRPATTTVCAFKSPSATSTLVSASASFRVASTSATVIHLAKSASFNATTTLLSPAVTIGAGAQGTVVATSSQRGVLDDAGVFAPNQYFVVGVQGGAQELVAGGFQPQGTCNATFEVN